MNQKKCSATILMAFLVGCLVLASCSGTGMQNAREQAGISLSEVPAYSGEPFIDIQENEPAFQSDDGTPGSFETYSELDSLGRCGTAFANVGPDLMPTKERGNIGQVKPTGWHSVQYDIVDGKSLYNRCHLIGYQLTAENANEKNLITGTRYLNVDGMLPFENMVADYVKETENHVLYRVTPVYQGEELVARGVQMEGYSVEDQGESICFNVFVYNVQPGVRIDYATGDSQLDDAQPGDNTEMGEIRGNSKSKIYHCPGQSAYEQMAESKNLVVFPTEQQAIDAGYRKAQR